MPRIPDVNRPAVAACERPDLVLQTGHTGGVAAVAFSPEDRYLASSSRDNTVKIWDLNKGFELRTLRGHTDSVNAVSFSPDGELLASGSADNTVKLWDVATGRQLFSMPTGNHIMGMVDVAFRSDGKTLISLNQDRTVTRWDVASGRQIGSFSAGGLTGTAWFTRITRDAHWVISDVRDKNTQAQFIELWDATTGKRVFSCPAGAGDYNNPTLSPDGRWMASNDQHAAVRMWDVAKGVMIYSLYGDPRKQSNMALGFAFSPDGKILAVGNSERETLQFLEVDTGRMIRSVDGTFTENLRFNSDGSRIAAIRGSEITILNPATGETLQFLRGNTRAISSLAISRDGRLLAAGGEDNQTRVWDLVMGREIRRVGGPLTRYDLGATAVAFSPDGLWVATNLNEANDEGFLVNRAGIWEVSTGRVVHKLEGFGNGVTSIAFSPDGSLIAAGDYIGRAQIWETHSWNVLGSLKGGSIREGQLWPASSLAFSPDGRWLALSAERGVALWNATTRQWSRSIEEAGYVQALAFSPDSKLLATVNLHSHHIEVWDLEAATCVLSIPEQPAEIGSLKFSADGSRLAAPGLDHTIHAWDAVSGRHLTTLSGHSGEVKAVAFTQDGRWLVSASIDGSVRLWDLSAGSATVLLATISGSDDWVTVTTDGLFDGSTDGTQKLVAWRIGNTLYPADRFYASNYTPRLLGRVLVGEKLASELKLDALRLPPVVRISNPPVGGKSKSGQAQVVVEATDQGGGVAEVRLFQNGKLIAKAPGDSGGSYRFDVDLVAGENVLKASALSQERVEANDDQVRVTNDADTADPVPARSALHLLVTGVSQYEDSALDLDYARPDAESIAEFFRQNKLFSSIHSYKLYDQGASKIAIQEALEKLVERAQANDVVIIYFAGHGVGVSEQFYFLPHDMRLEDDDVAAIRKYGIPASALADALMRVKALKQVLILDTCESEGALPLLAKSMMYRSRGVSVAEEKAVKMLARAYGVYLIAASARQQDAYEVPELGHGILTYALLRGLGENGEPQAPMLTPGIVTVGSLIEYVYAQVPELTEKYRHQKQYVVTSTTGTNFPLWSN